MRPRDRVRAALQHIEADRVPTGENSVDYTVVEQVLGRPTLCNSRWREVQALWDGRRDEIVADYKRDHVEIARAFEWDYVRVPVVPTKKEYRRPEMVGPYSWRDENGRIARFLPESGNVVEHAQTSEMTIDDLPDPNQSFQVDPTQLEAIAHVVRELGNTHFVIGRSPVDGTFPFQQTVGMEEFLVRMVTEPEFVERAIASYVNRSIAYIRAMLDLGCDAVMVTDDYADNRGPLMGPERFRRFILPGLRRQAEAAHAKGGYFIKHTDGNVWSVLDMLVEAGVDGWHGIQPSIGMDLARLKLRYGRELCFFGGVNCETLIEGTLEDVRREVRDAITGAAPGGGLVVTCGNVLQPGVKLENYLAQRQAVRDLGRYECPP